MGVVTTDTTTALGGLLQRTSDMIHRHTDQVLQEQLGIGMAQYRLLHILQEQTGIQQRTIADALGQTEASISRQIKLLHARGILVAERNLKRRREHVISLTPKGTRLAVAAADLLETCQTPFFAQLRDKDREQLTRLLEQLGEPPATKA